MNYLYGQRVIVDGDTLAIVIPEPDTMPKIPFLIWVRRIHDNFVIRYATKNVKPLPGGQL